MQQGHVVIAILEQKPIRLKRLKMLYKLLLRRVVLKQRVCNITCIKSLTIQHNLFYMKYGKARRRT
jgi:hypothetical protein